MTDHTELSVEKIARGYVVGTGSEQGMILLDNKNECWLASEVIDFLLTKCEELEKRGSQMEGFAQIKDYSFKLRHANDCDLLKSIHTCSASTKCSCGIGDAISLIFDLEAKCKRLEEHIKTCTCDCSCGSCLAIKQEYNLEE